MIHGLGILSSHQVIKNRMMIAIELNSKYISDYLSLVKCTFFALNTEHFV